MYYCSSTWRGYSGTVTFSRRCPPPSPSPWLAARSGRTCMFLCGCLKLSLYHVSSLTKMLQHFGFYSLQLYSTIQGPCEIFPISIIGSNIKMLKRRSILVSIQRFCCSYDQLTISQIILEGHYYKKKPKSLTTSHTL